MQLIVNFFGTSVIEVNENFVTGLKIREILSLKSSIPINQIFLLSDCRAIADGDSVHSFGSGIVHASIKCSIKGGKGGFGAMLRSLAKQSGGKKTSDFGACRDLSGRRLRHVNDEKILQRWKEAKDRGEDFDVEQETNSGIDLWFMSTPSWSDGFKGRSSYRKRYMKPRRKTQLCLDWLRARKEGIPPKNAPVFWGCPRGQKCEYAHGESELRGEALEKMQKEKALIRETQEEEKKEAYLRVVLQKEAEEAMMFDAVLSGIQARKKNKIKETSIPVLKSQDIATGTTATAQSITTTDSTTVRSTLTDNDSAISKPMNSSANQNEEMTVSKIAAHSITTSQNEGDHEEEEEVAVVNSPLSQLLNKLRDTPWLSSLNGGSEWNADGKIKCFEGFDTIIMPDTLLLAGKWYYEVTIFSSGLLQIGWIDSYFQSSTTINSSSSSSSGDGVGDDIHSWAYDGARQKKWNGSDVPYGSPWKEGDVIGCLLDINKSHNMATITYYINGLNLGDAFQVNLTSTIKPVSIATTSSSSRPITAAASAADNISFRVALSIEEGERAHINIGQLPFSYPIADLVDITSINRRNTEEFRGKERSTEDRVDTERTVIVNDSDNIHLKSILPVIYANLPSTTLSSISPSSASSTTSVTTSSKLTSDNTVPSNSSESTSKTVDIKGIASNKDNITTTTTTSTTAAISSDTQENIVYDPIDIDDEKYANVNAFEALGLSYLKAELARRGMKVGGTLQERANRLFAIRKQVDLVNIRNNTTAVDSTVQPPKGKRRRT